jgi:hypothetical protein
MAAAALKMAKACSNIEINVAQMAQSEGDAISESGISGMAATLAALAAQTWRVHRNVKKKKKRNGIASAAAMAALAKAVISGDEAEKAAARWHRRKKI